MKATLLILTAILPLAGCQSHNPRYVATSNFGYTYDLLAPLPGVDHRVAKMANLTLTPTTPKEVAPEPVESPDVGTVIFYQAPGTPSATNKPWIYTPPARVQTVPTQPQVPVQPYAPQGYDQLYGPQGYQPYDSYGPFGYNSGYGYPTAAQENPSQIIYGSPSAYSSETVVYGNGNPNPYTSYGPDYSQSYGQGYGNGNWQGYGNGNWQQNGGHPTSFIPTATWSAVPGATNNGNIQRFSIPPQGTPPGTALIDSRPFGQPPGTQLINNPPPGTQPYYPYPVPPNNGHPWNPAVGAPVTIYPSSPVQPPRGKQVQPVLPGAMPVPQNKAIQSPASRPAPAQAQRVAPPPASSKK